MEKIKTFLEVSSGRGDGSGRGYGSGYGSGDGSGYGYGGGSGRGSGYGDGRGRGIKSFNGQTVHIIDNVPTIITRIVNNLAKGFILESDFTLTPCFIAKGQNVFAHGKTAAEAMRALRDKIFENMDVGEKIKAFLKEVSLVQKYPAKFFYDWHHKLTGSCEMGRNRFVRDHNIDLENGEYTVREFIEITENDYGGDIIRRLKERISDI